jgi:hypothetical protein
MQGIQPQSLTDKELLNASLLMFEPDTGMPIAFQKEVVRRLASYVQDARINAETDYKTSHPNQLPLFD